MTERSRSVRLEKVVQIFYKYYSFFRPKHFIVFVTNTGLTLFCVGCVSSIDLSVFARGNKNLK